MEFVTLLDISHVNQAEKAALSLLSWSMFTDMLVGREGGKMLQKFSTLWMRRLERRQLTHLPLRLTEALPKSSSSGNSDDLSLKRLVLAIIDCLFHISRVCRIGSAVCYCWQAALHALSRWLFQSSHISVHCPQKNKTHLRGVSLRV